ncbi:2-phospho-L-lactate guanylyltransferase [Friedmanniella luteola]|uniref:2-phospho-L-lactate guanylyltransferase n=1 Tax=Friedmanniella luteola TaxID=546871 RepID=A0A1H1R594_9ACTN|nr:2-phospho-L-lactate guanylyltransferase [Friedmanniella luteola]SDS30840.1 2-phospho-L-lactate guanylyltransferase [Friedmanniella luteola]
MDTDPGAVQPPRPAAAVVALKPVAHAKSRLGTLPDPLRRRLAWTMAVDTLRALGGAVDLLLVVSDQPALASRLARAGLDVEVVPEAGAHGMNGALDRGAAVAAARGYRTVLGCVGDLPALRPASVRTVLDAVDGGRAFLADASGVGTTMLVAHGVPLDPHFQGRSAAAHHQSGAVPLTDDRLGTGVPDARCDVDTEVDLGPAAGLGLGPATTPLLVPGALRLATSTVVTTTGWSDDAGRPLAVSTEGHRLVLPDAAVDGLRTPLRIGQRLHAVHADGVVLSAWL